MAEPGAATRTLRAIARADQDDRGLAEAICRACMHGLEVDGAAVSLLTATDARETLWASDPTAELVEDLQFSLNEGACIQAASTGSPVLVPDLCDSTEVARWPMFAAALSEQTEVRALFALPLQWGAVNLGVLDLYRVAPGELSQAQWRDALAAADTAALMMLDLRMEVGGGGWPDQSVSRRAEIHQATGMVLAQLGVSAQEALARLRGYAFTEQRLLADVARDVVARRLVFRDDME